MSSSRILLPASVSQHRFEDLPPTILLLAVHHLRPFADPQKHILVRIRRRYRSRGFRGGRGRLSVVVTRLSSPSDLTDRLTWGSPATLGGGHSGCEALLQGAKFL